MQTDSQTKDGSASLADAASSAGWDIRLQCTVCGVRSRRHRNDYNGAIGDKPKATIETECSNCTCNAGYPPGGVQTVHFIDYASPREFRADS